MTFSRPYLDLTKFLQLKVLDLNVYIRLYLAYVHSPFPANLLPYELTLTHHRKPTQISLAPLNAPNIYVSASDFLAQYLPLTVRTNLSPLENYMRNRYIDLNGEKYKL